MNMSKGPDSAEGLDFDLNPFIIHNLFTGEWVLLEKEEIGGIRFFYLRSRVFGIRRRIGLKGEKQGEDVGNEIFYGNVWEV